MNYYPFDWRRQAPEVCRPKIPWSGIVWGAFWVTWLGVLALLALT